MIGKIVKGIGGFYYIDTENGIVECKPRGIFRKEGITPMVGDNADIDLTDEGKGVITHIRERTNMLTRPPVANVTQIIICVSVMEPSPDYYMIDKLIFSAEVIGLDIIICVNKTDLGDSSELTDIYRNAGFTVLTVSVKDNMGIEAVRERISGNITVLAGNSGVGKSSMLNRLVGREAMQTGSVGDKSGRGKHTTRHCELIALEGGFLIDTPGFSSFDVSGSEEAALYFREFAQYTCQFPDCRHITERECAVRNAVEKNMISQNRYDNYVRIYTALEKVNKW